MFEFILDNDNALSCFAFVTVSMLSPSSLFLVPSVNSLLLLPSRDTCSRFSHVEMLSIDDMFEIILDNDNALSCFAFVAVSVLSPSSLFLVSSVNSLLLLPSRDVEVM